MREERGTLNGNQVISEAVDLWGTISGNVTVVDGGKMYVRGAIYGHLKVAHGGRVHIYGNVSGNLNLGGQIFDTGSQGTKLSNRKLTAIVTRSLTSGLPTDANGVYLVLTASDISEQGFCSQFCGCARCSLPNRRELAIAYGTTRRAICCID